MSKNTTKNNTEEVLKNNEDDNSLLNALNDILAVDEQETAKIEKLIYNTNDAPNQKPQYVFINNIVSATHKSQWTKNLNGSQINTLIEYLQNDEELPDIALKEIAKNSSLILKSESDALKFHILDDLENVALGNNVPNFNLIDKDVLLGLSKRIVADNKNIDLHALEPGIYVDLYLKGFLSRMPNVDEIDARLKQVVLTAFVPVTLVDKNKKLHFILPQLKTTINSEFYIFYQWFKELLSYSGLLPDEYDVTFACVDYKIVKEADFKIDYVPFNTFAIAQSPALSNVIYSADKLSDILSKPNHKDLVNLTSQELEDVKAMLESVRLANKLQASYSKKLPFSKFHRDNMYLLDDNTITNLKKLLKLGALNGNLLGNNSLKLNDPQTNYNYKVYSSYDLASYENNPDFFSYAGYNDKKQIDKLKKQVDTLSKNTTNKLIETTIDYENLVSLVDNSKTELYASNLRKKEPASSDVNFSDFALMKVLYSSRSSSDYAYTVYDYANNIIPNARKYNIYTYFKQAGLKNKTDLINWLKNPNSKNVQVDPVDWSIIGKLKDLYGIDRDNYNVYLDNTVYNAIRTNAEAFNSNFNSKLNNQPLVHYDFETISTFFNIVKGQIGKIQLPTQASVVCTDKNLNIITEDGFESIDIVIDPLKLEQDKDYKNIIDSLYFRMKNLNAKGVVYNKGFESHRLLEMLRYINDDDGSYAKKVDYINENTEDLMLFYAQSNYKINIGELKGKYSIKKLEPYPTSQEYQSFSNYLNDKYHLLHYNTLAINRGDFAQLKTLQRLMNETNDEVWKTDSKELGIYCHNDVVNMIKQIANLKEVNELIEKYLQQASNNNSSQALKEINEASANKDYITNANMQDALNVSGNKDLWKNVNLKNLISQDEDELAENKEEKEDNSKNKKASGIKRKR